jgi:hypothetical protein
MSKFLTEKDNIRYFIVEHDVFEEPEDVTDGIRVITNKVMISECSMLCPYVDEITETFSFDNDSFFDIEYGIMTYMSEFLHDQMRKTRLRTDYSKDQKSKKCPKFIFKTFEEAAELFRNNGYDDEHHSIAMYNIASLVHDYAFLYEDKPVNIMIFQDCSKEEGCKLSVLLRAAKKIINNTSFYHCCYPAAKYINSGESLMEGQLKYLDKRFTDFTYIYIENINSESGKELRKKIAELGDKYGYDHGILNYLFEKVEEV